MGMKKVKKVKAILVYRCIDYFRYYRISIFVDAGNLL